MFRKSALTLLTILALAGISTSCHRNNLAAEIAGAWSGTPEKVEDPSAVSTTILDTYSFTQDDNSAGGTLIIAGLISTERALPQTDALIEPITFTASGQASISGTWDVTGDEIVVSLDPRTLSITVAPECVVYRENMADEQTASSLDSITPQLKTAVHEDFKQVASEHLLSIRKLDNVKINGQTLTFNLNGQPQALRREGAE